MYILYTIPIVLCRHIQCPYCKHIVNSKIQYPYCSMWNIFA
nr:MAG TPA: cysteine-rich protein [Inoviridae sp.]